MREIKKNRLLSFLAILLTFLSFFLLSGSIFAENFSQNKILLSQVDDNIDESLPEPELSDSTPTPIPSGQVINLAFNIPGIGTNGANLKPLRQTRNVAIYFFDLDVNTQDMSVKPRGSVKAQVQFDDDPASPTYTSFVNPQIYLGNVVPDGEYQIVFKTDQALAVLVKGEDKALGGQKFRTQNSFGADITITNQTVIPGDIAPGGAGDNIMNISDYNGLVECFGEKANSQTCPDKQSADLNDDGVVDGVDYNILFRSFNTLLSLGFPVPTLSVSGAPSPPAVNKEKAEKSKEASTSAGEEKSAGSVSVLGLAITIFTIILLIISVVLYIFNSRFKEFVKRLVAKLPFIPHSQSKDDTPAPPVDASVPVDGIVDKDYYVKKQTVNETNQRTVYVLTDDNGPTLGYYTGSDAADGFARVKGVMKNENGKAYIEVTEILPSQT